MDSALQDARRSGISLKVAITLPASSRSKKLGLNLSLSVPKGTISGYKQTWGFANVRLF